MFLELEDGSFTRADLINTVGESDDVLILGSPIRAFMIRYPTHEEVMDEYATVQTLIEKNKANPKWAARVQASRIRELKKYSDSIYQWRSNGTS